jgi:hypothetical protein
MQQGRSSNAPVDWLSRRLLFVIAIVYIFTAKGYIEAGDTSFSLQTAEAIVSRGRLDIERHPAGATLTGTDGLSYSKYGIGLPLVFVPLVALSHLLTTAAKVPTLESAGFLISFLNVPFCLITVVLFERLLRQFGAAVGYARLLTAGLALGTLCWRYAVYDFSEGMQATLLLLAVYGVVGGSTGRLASGGLGFAALILVKLVHITLLPVFVGYLLWRYGVRWSSRTRAAAFVAPVVMAIGLVCLLNVLRFGNALESGYGAEAREFYPAQLRYSLPSLLLSLDKGLLVFCPVLVLGIAGWPAFLRRLPREAVLCAGIIVINSVLSGAWWAWEGGGCWGPRMLVPSIPLWLLPAGLLFNGAPSARTRGWFAAIVLVSAVIQVPGVLVKDQQIHHTKQVMLTGPERAQFPADWTAVWVFLGHKLTHSDEVYTVPEFGVLGERTLDVTAYRTFNGINVWTEHVARNFSKPWVRFLPLAGLAAVLAAGAGAVDVFRVSRLNGDTTSGALRSAPVQNATDRSDTP